MQWLRQSTSTTVKIGPFLDSTDGDTEETGLTIAQADVRLSKNGGDIAQKTEATSCTHDELGIYGCPLDTTDTGTLGRLQLWVHEGGALLVWHEFMVVPANVWDSFFGSDLLNVDVHAIDDDATAADNLEAYCDGTTPIPANATQISADATAADNLELFTEIANITSLTVDASGHLECDVVEIEGADPTDTIRDAVVDDATRIDASALNTLSGHDPGSTLCADGTPLTAAETESEANDALVALHLDHLLATDYDPASKPGTATALLNEIVESDGGVSRFTANALEQGPDTTTALTLHSDYDAAKAAAPASEYDTEMGRITANVALASICTETRLAELDAANLPTDIADVPTVAEFNARTQPTADYFDPGADAVANVTLVATTTTNTDMVGTDSAALASVCTETRLAELDAANLPTDIAALPTTAEVNTEVDTALSDIHLHHLLAADYDPASKPGTATALLNELIESDAGVSRFTENSLEQAPSGTGASAATIADAVWNEAAADHVAAGSFGVQAGTDIDAILADTNELQTDDIPSAISGLNDPTAVTIRTEIDSNSTQLAAIVTDTNELQTDDIPTLIGALNNIAVTDITQRQIPDSVPADGTLPTIEQAIYMIVQRLYEAVVVDTTMTVRKVDGSTTLLTLTLDDPTDPTSITRAT